MEKKKKLQWHPAFYSAVELELRDNKGDLDYFREYNLSSKPLQMDLLIIEKRDDVEIKNEIGHIFRKYNIIEYKGPGDLNNVDAVLQVGVAANKKLFDRLKGEDNMCEALKELMKDELDLATEKGRVEGRAEGRNEEKRIIAIKMYKKGHPAEEIAEYADVPVKVIIEWLKENKMQ